MENNQSTKQYRKNTNKEWSLEETFLLIDAYRERPQLWDTNHNEYQVKSKRFDLWEEIANILYCSVTDIKKKMESLLTSFRRERQRCEDTNKLLLSAGSEDLYKSKWFAFEKMKFLLHKYTPLGTLVTTDTTEDSWDVPIDDKSDSEDSSSSSDAQESESKKPKLCKNSMLDQRAEEAYNILQTAVKKRIERDPSKTFGKHIANKHRTYSSHTKSMVEHLFAKILYEADLGKYEEKHAFDAASSLSTSSRNFSQRSSTSYTSISPRTTIPTSRGSQQLCLKASSPAYHSVSRNPTPSLPGQRINQPYYIMVVPQQQKSTIPNDINDSITTSNQEDCIKKEQ